jgi:hypothetical protein
VDDETLPLAQWARHAADYEYEKVCKDPKAGPVNEQDFKLGFIAALVWDGRWVWDEDATEP